MITFSNQNSEIIINFASMKIFILNTYINNMELTSENIHRYLNILRFRIKKNRYKIFKKVLAYIYLFLSYAAFVGYFSYSIRIANKPLGAFFLDLHVLCYFVVWTLLNHLILKKTVPHRVLLLIEILLFITLWTIFWSDLMYENRPR